MDLSALPASSGATEPVLPERLGGAEWLAIDDLMEPDDLVGGMVVGSDQFRRIITSIERFAPYKATVLVNGESGTGKELVARALHKLGPTPNGPFVTFNCSNLVDSLAESQLFGHIRGAFTDAREESMGYFRSANGGTLFLDEIGELPLKLQPKLLRAVETHEVQPVGSSHTYRVDIRIVAATNRDLRAMVARGEFRDDLFYRLNAAVIEMPPLRYRREAIPAMVGHFGAHFSKLFGKDLRYISREALSALYMYNWPGNVRELSHAVESALLICENGRIVLGDLPSAIVQGGVERQLGQRPSDFATGDGPAADNSAIANDSETASAAGSAASFSLEEAINEASKNALVRALSATGGNCHRAADLLGVSRYTVYRMLNRFGLVEMRERRGIKIAD